MTIKLLELFAGSRSIGNEADKMGMEVFSVDWKPFDKIDMVVDIEEMMPYQVPFIPDVVWASFDCTTYSVAAVSHHRKDGQPIS